MTRGQIKEHQRRSSLSRGSTAAAADRRKATTSNRAENIAASARPKRGMLVSSTPIVVSERRFARFERSTLSSATDTRYNRVLERYF